MPRRSSRPANRMDIFVYLDRAMPELERSVQASNLALGCTPIVNLFEQRCEPIPVDHTRIEYRIEPDVRRPASLEIWSVETRARKACRVVSFRAWEPFHRLTRSPRRRDCQRLDRRVLRNRPPARPRAAMRGNRSLPVAARCGVRSGWGEQRCPVDRRTVLQPRSAGRAWPFGRRPAGASAGSKAPPPLPVLRA